MTKQDGPITHWKFNNIFRRSLGIKNGTLRPENFDVQELLTEKFLQHHSINGVEVLPPTDKGKYWTGQNLDMYLGYDLPDFHRRRNAGELMPFTPYINVTHSLTATGYRENWKTRTNGDVHHYWHTAVSGGNPPQLLVSNPLVGYNPFDLSPLNMALSNLTLRGIDPAVFVQKAASKIYSRGWDMLTFQLELHKSMRLIASSLSRAKDLLFAFDKEFGSKGIGAGNLLAKTDPSLDEWLSVRYGWRLLLYDIQDIAAAIGQTEGTFRERTTQRSGISQTWDDDLSYSYTNPGVWTDNMTDVRSNDLSVRGSIVTDFLPATISVNPFVSGWEVIPFSFVIDWLINIGRAITTLSFLTLTDQYTAAWSISYFVSRKASLVTTPLDGRTFNAYQTVDQTYEVLYRRPCFIPSTPLLGINFDAAKFIDLVALIDGAIRGVLLYY